MPKRTASTVFTVVTRANQPIKVLPANPRRLVWSAMNLSDTEVFFGYSPDVGTSGRKKGWRIAPSYGTVEDEYAKDEVYIICASAGKEVTIAETSEVPEGG